MAESLRIKGAADELQANIGRVILGQQRAVELLLVAALAGGHVLIEDLPGTGKTTLAKSLAKSLHCSFRRIQFTPDLMPSDVTGYNFFDQKEREFRFRPGPVMANLVLADEINRAIPRTQSSLLECMGEGQVTVDGETRSLPQPFMVIATQNPVDLEGTFPLPEAQLDRFLLQIRLGYPGREIEEEIILTHGQGSPLDSLEPVLQPEEILEMREKCQGVRVAASLRNYLLEIVDSTRSHPAVELGASPRASLGYYKAVRVLAALRGRDYVLPDDIKELAGPVLAHRLVIKTKERLRGIKNQDVIRGILAQAKVPLEEEANRLVPA